MHEHKYVTMPEKSKTQTGFESRSGLNFFQALISQLLKLCVTAMINHKIVFVFWLSRLRRFPKPPFSKCFQSTRFRYGLGRR